MHRKLPTIIAKLYLGLRKFITDQSDGVLFHPNNLACDSANIRLCVDTVPIRVQNRRERNDEDYSGKYQHYAVKLLTGHTFTGFTKFVSATLFSGRTSDRVLCDHSELADFAAKHNIVVLGDMGNNVAWFPFGLSRG